MEYRFQRPGKKSYWERFFKNFPPATGEIRISGPKNPDMSKELEKALDAWTDLELPKEKGDDD